MKKTRVVKKEARVINSNVVNNSDLDQLDYYNDMASQNHLNKTIKNSDILDNNTSRDITLADNFEMGQGRNFESMNQPLSARINENPDLCDRIDHDKLLPVTSNEEFN